MSLRPTWKTILALSLVLGQTSVLVQAQYTTEEYSAYEMAVNADPAERHDAIVAFLTANPKSALVEYAVGSYLQLMQEYQNQGQSQQVVSAGEKLLGVRPEDLNAQYMTAIAAYQIQDFDKATGYGEDVYAAKPDTGLAFVLANSYAQLGNQDKQIEYGDKACSELAPKDCFQILSQIGRIFAGRKEWARAAEYAEKAVEGLDAAGKPGQMSDSEWKNYLNTEKATAYTVLGRSAAERKSWNDAITNYQKVISLSQDPAAKAEAYYYTGMGRWDQKQMDSAMSAFARGSIQKDAPHAEHCRQYLETLYKSTHNDSLAGIDEFVARVSGL
jgi:tetratricopeptide (TPR) repeat protein